MPAAETFEIFLQLRAGNLGPSPDYLSRLSLSDINRKLADLSGKLQSNEKTVQEVPGRLRPFEKKSRSWRRLGLNGRKSRRASRAARGCNLPAGSFRESGSSSVAHQGLVKVEDHPGH